RRATSDSPASTFRPARSSSLFLAGWASESARCLSVSMTAYSSLGMVKLSRTSLGCLARTSLACNAGAGVGAALAGAGVGERLTVLAGAFLAIVLVWPVADFFTPDAVVVATVLAAAVLAAGCVGVALALWLVAVLEVVMV